MSFSLLKKSAILITSEPSEIHETVCAAMFDSGAISLSKSLSKLAPVMLTATPYFSASASRSKMMLPAAPPAVFFAIFRTRVVCFCGALKSPFCLWTPWFAFEWSGYGKSSAILSFFRANNLLFSVA